MILSIQIFFSIHNIYCFANQFIFSKLFLLMHHQQFPSTRFDFQFWWAQRPSGMLGDSFEELLPLSVFNFLFLVNISSSYLCFESIFLPDVLHTLLSKLYDYYDKGSSLIYTNVPQLLHTYYNSSSSSWIDHLGPRGINIFGPSFLPSTPSFSPFSDDFFKRTVEE